MGEGRRDAPYFLRPWPNVFWALVIFMCQLQCFTGRANASGIRLNVPRVRLPYFDNHSVNFTLHVDIPGCYKWTASRSDIIKLTTTTGKDVDADGGECSNSVVISTSPKSSIILPASGTIFVEEVNTKENVRCDVTVDKVEEINIITTNSFVHLEEAPSKFHVRAYSTNRNEFSTLEGVPIKWWLESSSGVANLDPSSIMRFLRFSDSMYEASPATAHLENNRLQGSAVLVEGLKTGSVVVNAKLQSSYYKHVPKAEVKIVAVANLLLEPTDVYIVPETTIPLKLIQMKQGRLVEIKLPSETYLFDVENTTVASYDAATSTVTGLEYGETKITVRDKSHLDENNNEIMEALTAYIYVRQPKFLAFTVKPYHLWKLMMGQSYTIIVDVFDSDNQKIHVGNSLFIKTTIQSDYFKPEFSSVNGTYHVGQPIKTGISKVTAELKHYIKRDGTRVSPPSSLRINAEMEILQRVAINPKLTVLPWDSRISPKHEIIFKASGGDGNFQWISTNTSVITVSQTGHGKTVFYGVANVTAAMSANPHIKGDAKVYVLQPSSMKIVDHIVEAEIGAPILIPLAFYTKLPDTEEEIPFTTCRHLTFKVDIEEPTFIFDSKTYYPHAKPACAYLPIIGHQLGSSLVTVTFEADGISFKDSVTVSTFKPLKVVEPLSEVTVLAVGSTRQLVFEGGPRPLLERIADFSRKTLVANQTVATVSPIQHQQMKDDLYIYEVLCREIGQTLITLEIGNSRESVERLPVRRTRTVQVICGEPSKIYFKIDTVLSEADIIAKCPHDLSSAQLVRIPVPNYEKITVSVTVKDEKGNRFDNITSLNIIWTTSLNIVFFQHEKYIPTERIETFGYVVPGKGLQIIRPLGKSGNVEISAEILGYRSDVLKIYGIRPNMKLAKVDPTEEYLYQRSFSMELQLVSDLVLKPQSNTLFNHPSSKTEIYVAEGSGYFEVSSFPTTLVDAIYYESNRTVIIKPLQEGDVKIVVRDLCLSGQPSSSTTIKINGVGSIVVEVADSVEVSMSTTLLVHLFDRNGNELTSKELALIKLLPVSFTNDIIDIELKEMTTVLEYKLTGKSIGDGTIAFLARGPGRNTKSEIKRIHVYPPMTVSPKQVTMVIGSVYQALAQGGPRQNSVVEFVSEHKSKVAVTPVGIIQGRALGSSKITARAIDKTLSTIYSEDSLEVNVVNLAGLRIHTPLTKIQVNQAMPTWAVGISPVGVELDPVMLYGGKHPLMTFDWSLGGSDNAEIAHPFQKYGLVQSNDLPYFRFLAKKPGRVIIKVTGTLLGKSYYAEAIIDIFDELRVVNLPVPYTPILMSPNSEFSLKTNKDSLGITTYTTQFPSNLDEFDFEREPVLSVDAAGTVRSSDKTGDGIVRVSFTDSNSGILESISYVILIRLVSYQMINPDDSSSFQRQNVTFLPTGISFAGTVSYHDSYGRPFHVTNLSPILRPNRLDVVTFFHGINNNTIEAKNSVEGRIGLSIYNGQLLALKDFLFVTFAEWSEPEIAATSAADVMKDNVMCFPYNVNFDNLTKEELAKNLSIAIISNNLTQYIDIPLNLKVGPPAAAPEMGWSDTIVHWSFNWSYFWILTPIVTTIFTLGVIHLVWQYLESKKKPNPVEYLFISPRTNSPRTHRMTPIDENPRADSTTPIAGRRLFSTNGSYQPYRFSSNYSPNSVPKN